MFQTSISELFAFVGREQTQHFPVLGDRPACDVDVGLL
jgi:hypothetical protein